MLKKLMITTAVSALMIGAAAAQSSPPPASSAPASPSASTGGGAQFINSQSGDQWLSSGFIGTDVVGADDAKIGDVADILFDKDGKVIAYVVGVGGFLGIGAKNVALAPSAFQVVPASNRSTTGTAAGAPPRSDDFKLKLSQTKDQLQQAAAFESKRDKEAKMRSQTTGAPGGGLAPRPSSPAPSQPR